MKVLHIYMWKFLNLVIHTIGKYFWKYLDFWVNFGLHRGICLNARWCQITMLEAKLASNLQGSRRKMLSISYYYYFYQHHHYYRLSLVTAVWYFTQIRQVQTTLLFEGFSIFCCYCLSTWHFLAWSTGTSGLCCLEFIGILFCVFPRDCYKNHVPITGCCLCASKWNSVYNFWVTPIN